MDRVVISGSLANVPAGLMTERLLGFLREQAPRVSIYAYIGARSVPFAWRAVAPGKAAAEAFATALWKAYEEIVEPSAGDSSEPPGIAIAIGASVGPERTIWVGRETPRDKDSAGRSVDHAERVPGAGAAGEDFRREFARQLVEVLGTPQGRDEILRAVRETEESGGWREVD